MKVEEYQFNLIKKLCAERKIHKGWFRNIEKCGCGGKCNKKNCKMLEKL
ncbi:hypothetical protein ACU5B5_10295 (plasmid) [Clostridioides difficile]|nr:hypothetical protein [Clostridioides difficile]MBY2783208.1 hypothetical protein [Clostridioides difficile]HBF6515524.1 hypothetical protein [Clostridioides difficile]HBG1651400.1 hypothetical protein [Clostridioides difficile]